MTKRIQADRNDKCPWFNSVIPSEVEASVTDLIRFANMRRSEDVVPDEKSSTFHERR